MESVYEWYYSLYLYCNFIHWPFLPPLPSPSLPPFLPSLPPSPPSPSLSPPSSSSAFPPSSGPVGSLSLPPPPPASQGLLQDRLRAQGPAPGGRAAAAVRPPQAHLLQPLQVS